MNIGYARVSSAGQSLDVQLEQLAAAGCERIFQEKMSGTTLGGREQLENALLTLRDGDVLIVTRLDRLARSVPDLHAIAQRIDQAGAAFRCTQQGGVDTSTSTGKLMLTILGAVAEFENDIRRERQLDGIAAAKAEGRYRRGGSRQINRARIRDALLADRGRGLDAIGPTAIAAELGISRSSLHRIERELIEAGELPPIGAVPAQE